MDLYTVSATLNSVELLTSILNKTQKSNNKCHSKEVLRTIINGEHNLTSGTLRFQSNGATLLDIYIYAYSYQSKAMKVR